MVTNFTFYLRYYIWDQCYLRSYTRRCGPLNRHNAMQLTTGEFEYLGKCTEGFLFGTLSVLQMPRPLTKSH